MDYIDAVQHVSLLSKQGFAIGAGYRILATFYSKAFLVIKAEMTNISLLNRKLIVDSQNVGVFVCNINN